MKESPEDIQEKLLRQEITVEEAKEAKIFRQPEQREQYLEQRRVIKRQQDKELEKHKSIRAKEAEAIERGERPIIAIDTSELDFNKQMVERCQDVYLKAALAFRADHIQQVTNLRMRNECVSWLRQTYEHCQRTLGQLDELELLS